MILQSLLYSLTSLFLSFQFLVLIASTIAEPVIPTCIPSTPLLPSPNTINCLVAISKTPQSLNEWYFIFFWLALRAQQELLDDLPNSAAEGNLLQWPGWTHGDCRVTLTLSPAGWQRLFTGNGDSGPGIAGDYSTWFDVKDVARQINGRCISTRTGTGSAGGYASLGFEKQLEVSIGHVGSSSSSNRPDEIDWAKIYSEANDAEKGRGNADANQGHGPNSNKQPNFRVCVRNGDCSGGAGECKSQSFEGGVVGWNMYGTKLLTKVGYCADRLSE